MNLKLSCNQKTIIKKQQIQITGSKSETNRLLLLQALYPRIKLENTSNSDDSNVMTKALTSNPQLKTPNFLKPTTNNQTIDIHHAGTAMRFLTAFFAQKEGAKVILTGSKRMQERPIKILVEALQFIGAEISYLKNEGFPPIQIIGKKLIKNNVSLPANVSSQYISALLLIAPKLENGLELTLKGAITSVPYIKMTLDLLTEVGIENSFIGNLISVQHKSQIENPKTIIVESDWSSASYFYSIVALSEIGTEIQLSSYKQDSLQGDSALVEIYDKLGVKTYFEKNKMTLVKQSNLKLETLNLDLNNAPDIAQTIAVTCFGLNVNCKMTGLHTLKIKETDRLEALKNELRKLGANITVTNDTLTLTSNASHSIAANKSIKTYQDHRMAMAFAPLALKTSLIIEDAAVVSKSYPDFWTDLKKIGFDINEV